MNRKLNKHSVLENHPIATKVPKSVQLISWALLPQKKKMAVINSLYSNLISDDTFKLLSGLKLYLALQTYCT